MAKKDKQDRKKFELVVRDNYDEIREYRSDISSEIEAIISIVKLRFTVLSFEKFKSFGRQISAIKVRESINGYLR